MKDLTTDTLAADAPASAGRKAKGSVKSTDIDTTLAPPKAAKPRKLAETKAEIVLKRLRLTKGVSVPALVEVTGWQAHSVRGFLSGTVRKKLALPLTSEVGKDGVRRYRIGDAPASA